MTIVLINGAKRSGKDFTANLLKEKLGVNHTTDTLSFATPLKQIVADTFGISLEELEMFKNEYQDYGVEVKVYPNNQPSSVLQYTNFREILQRFGTEGMKPIFGESVWADIMADKCFDSESDYIFIPDFRFNVESDAIKKLDEDNHGFKIVTLKIRNDDIDTTDAHASERELDDYKFDYTIDNTGHTDKLSDYVDSFINTHLV